MSKEASPETNIVTAAPRRPRSIEDDEGRHSADVKSMDIVEMSETESEGNEENEDKPSQGEVISWCFYELCSYFTHTVLLTIVFPLIISQTFKEPPEPARGWFENRNGFHCTKKETVLFEALTYARIKVGSMKFSPLEWTSISWFTGLIAAAPLLASISIHLDYRRNSQLITAVATAIGAIFCLPAGAIKTVWIMPPYIAAIVASNTVGFEALTYARIKVGSMKFSPLEWTSISWFTGLIAAAPLLASISIHLDYRRNSQLITAVATAIGAIFCLPAGAIKTVWIMPPYIAAIVASNTVGSAFHNRHLGLMVRGFVGDTIRKLQFPDRQAILAGCLGSAAIASFTYYMLRNSEGFISLWVVSIFSGILWFAGIAHIVTATRSNGSDTLDPDSVSSRHFISIFNYPHATGSLVGVFLSSFATMSIFAGGLLYIVGQLCTPPKDLLFVWLIYFFFPIFVLPMLQPVQRIIRSDAVKMQIFGFLLSTFTSGMGFYYRRKNWRNSHVLFLAAAQSIASGVLHAYSRILLMDCAPTGKEGVFAAWFSWVRMFGAFVGFAIGSSGVGSINRSFGAAFVAAVIGIVALIFSNVSSYSGAVAAGHVHKRGDVHIRASDAMTSKIKEKESLEESQDRSLEV
ncbi:major facilitator superfamily domain-containing protein [Artemisia annua]|uniref:Major facilitator superfamily domain-containing protein n=1 Tax=Artemisia annua TaxID=35608 RepID=A0A2U1LUG1_ARTAN|nr:major facilitator superfamily domain-containing protein [Artemisia annua]